MSAGWQDYRMWRQPVLVDAVGSNSAERVGKWRATELTFRGRSQAEAQRKAERFWQDAELGAGSVLCVLDGTKARLNPQ